MGDHRSVRQRKFAQKNFTQSLFPALRRVSSVEVTVSDHTVTSRVIGMGHRHPVCIDVPLALANRLVSQGAPLHIHSSAGPQS